MPPPRRGWPHAGLSVRLYAPSARVLAPVIRPSQIMDPLERRPQRRAIRWRLRQERIGRPSVRSMGNSKTHAEADTMSRNLTRVRLNRCIAGGISALVLTLIAIIGLARHFA
jgi:hypothetical protein